MVPILRRHFVGLLVGLAVLTLLALLGDHFIGRPLRADRDYQAAQTALKCRDYEAAQVAINRCLKVFPDHFVYQLLAARICRCACAFNEAENHLDQCRKLSGDALAIALEGMLLRAQRGDLAPEVENQLWNCVEANHPDAVLILEALVQGYVEVFCLNGVKTAVAEWLKRRPDDAQAFVWRGWLAERTTRYADAEADLRQAVALDPEHEAARLSLAQILLDHNSKVEEAAGLYEWLLQRQPHNPLVGLQLARCRHALGRVGEAERLLDEVLAANPGYVKALTERARLALGEQQLDRAEAWLRQAVARAPGDVEVNSALAACLRKNGKETEADKVQAQVLRLKADRKELAELIHQVSDRPRGPDIRYQIGVLFHRLGQPEEGQRWLGMALREDPRHSPSHAFLADYYARTGQRELADSHRRQVRQEAGTHHSVSGGREK